MLKEASRLYAASWVRDIGPDLRPNDYKKHDEDENDKANGSKSATKEKEPSVLEDLGENLLPHICYVQVFNHCFVIDYSAFGCSSNTFLECLFNGYRDFDFLLIYMCFLERNI